MRAGLSPEGIRCEALWEGRGVSYDKRIARGNPGYPSKEALSNKARLAWPMQLAQTDSGCRVGCRAALDRAEVVRIVRIKREECSEPHKNH